MKLAAAMAVLLAAGVAHAAGPVRLEFERAKGAESCPERDTFEAIVASRVGSLPWSTTATRLVRILFAADGGRMTGRMELLEGGAVLGVRDGRSENRDCRELAESLALAVVLAIEPPGVTRRSAPNGAIGTSDDVLNSPGSAERTANAAAFVEITPVEPPRAIAAADAGVVIVPKQVRQPGKPIPLMLFAGSEGGYSFWSGGTQGSDERYQSATWFGDVAAGGEAPLAHGYTLDVLVTGYSATRRDRHSYREVEQHGRLGDPDDSLYVNQSVGATAMRAAVRWDGEDAGVSLGVLAGGFRQHGCHHHRVEGWATPLCSDLQQWAAFPTFGARMGPESGPYATLGVLDGRSLGGELAHIGVGAILPGDRRIDTSIVAAAEGVGVRVQMELPLGKSLVLMPALSGGIVYDTFTVGGRNSWTRAGCAVAVRR